MPIFVLHLFVVPFVLTSWPNLFEFYLWNKKWGQTNHCNILHGIDNNSVCCDAQCIWRKLKSLDTNGTSQSLGPPLDTYWPGALSSPPYPAPYHLMFSLDITFSLISSSSTTNPIPPPPPPSAGRIQQFFVESHFHFTGPGPVQNQQDLLSKLKLKENKETHNQNDILCGQ